MCDDTDTDIEANTMVMSNGPNKGPIELCIAAVNRIREDEQ